MQCGLSEKEVSFSGVACLETMFNASFVRKKIKLQIKTSYLDVGGLRSAVFLTLHSIDLPVMFHLLQT